LARKAFNWSTRVSSANHRVIAWEIYGTVEKPIELTLMEMRWWVDDYMTWWKKHGTESL